MQFTPKTEEEIQASLMVPEGNYNFKVIGAEDRISKKGNEMIELKLSIRTPDGSEKSLSDYLLQAMEFKLLHFCDCTGLMGKYNSGNLQASDCLGKSGTAVIIVQQGQQKPEGGYYPDKNAVKDYIKDHAQAQQSSEAPPFSDSDIPF